MNEQEAKDFSAELTKEFPGVVIYPEHNVYDHEGQHYDYWRLWVSQESCEHWYRCQVVASVSQSDLAYFRKLYSVLIGK